MDNQRSVLGKCTADTNFVSIALNQKLSILHEQ